MWSLGVLVEDLAEMPRTGPAACFGRLFHHARPELDRPNRPHDAQSHFIKTYSGNIHIYINIHIHIWYPPSYPHLLVLFKGKLEA